MMRYLAAGNGPDWSLLPQSTPESVLQGILNGVFFGLGIVAVGFIIYSGIRFQLSRGSASKMVEARTMLIFSVIGLAVAMAAWAIVSFVLGAFR